MRPSAYSSSHQFGDNGRDAAARSQLANVRPRPPNTMNCANCRRVNVGCVIVDRRARRRLECRYDSTILGGMKPTAMRAALRWDELPFLGTKFWLPGSVLLFAALAAYCELCTLLAGLPRAGIGVSALWAL